MIENENSVRKDACRVDQPGLCFCTLGRKTLAIMLIYIGDGIRDSLKKKNDSYNAKKTDIKVCCFTKE